MTDQKTIRLTKEEILNKEFKSSFHGYQPDEVDQFLDIVIKDYEVFNAEVLRLREENKKLKNELMSEDTTRNKSAYDEEQGQTNYDILKRLSNLEKHVFGNRIGN
ncbi:cell division regulator GpsB [Sporolactobacillus spathodeae]|uniref:DivIVA domain-containing protein n=1 Tax=Sporolactobacillus spathodeae TaxID=1465502 RepID=A0ABS2Q8K6_9BACL|nr:cell division regulator GpsB [Sporolactobacillus spathodeae]MBM7657941.1 DivIVA domain-containing protein [Sporolactobacillus spathodeae]